MSTFPTVWELLLPNFNIWTLLGIMIIVASVFVFKAEKLGRSLGLNMKSISGFVFLAGIFLIWGISILQDFINSKGGVLIFWLSIITVIVGFILFWNPKAGKKK